LREKYEDSWKTTFGPEGREDNEITRFELADIVKYREAVVWDLAYGNE
jgi:hypothetical protein